MRHLPRNFFRDLCLWSALWLVLIGGVGALWNLSRIKDDRRRAALEESGARTIGVLSSINNSSRFRDLRHCSKRGGSDAIVYFKPRDWKPRGIGVSSGALPPEIARNYSCHRPLPHIRIGVTYDPKNPSRFFVTFPGGPVPRQHLTGIWSRWRKHTAILFAVFSLGTALALVIARAKAPVR